MARIEIVFIAAVTIMIIHVAIKLQRMEEISNDDDEVKETDDNESSNSNTASQPNMLPFRHNQQSTIALMRYGSASIRRLLLVELNDPLSASLSSIVDDGLIDALVTAFGIDDPDIQYDAAWSLATIASRDSTMAFKVVNAGALPPIITMCYSLDISHAGICTLAIGIIADDSTPLRDRMINEGGLTALVYLIDKIDEFNFIRILSQSYSSLCKGIHEQLSANVVDEMIYGLVAMMTRSDDKVVQIDCCQSISYLIYESKQRNSILLQYDIVMQKMIDFLASDDDSLVLSSLTLLINIAAGNDAQKQVVIDSNVLTSNIFHSLFDTRRASIVRLCCKLISNIVAGTTLQIESVIDAQLLPHVIRVLDEDDIDVQIEAGWSISNLVLGATPEQIYILYELGAVRPMCKALVMLSVELTVKMLLALDAMLNIFNEFYIDEYDELRVMIGTLVGVEDIIERLERYENAQVDRLAQTLVYNHFIDDNDHLEYADNYNLTDITIISDE